MLSTTVLSAEKKLGGYAIRCATSMRKISLLFFLMALSSVSLWADTYGVSVKAVGSFCTNSLYGCYPGDTNYPSSNETKSATGSTSASAMVSAQGTTSDRTNPAGTTSSYFSSVSASEGHVGLSFDGYAEGIGNSQGYGQATWYDVLTVGGVPLNTPVTLEFQLGITAEFVGLGWGSDSVTACFNTPIYFCTSGGDGSSGLTLPATVTDKFDAYGGEKIGLSGGASGVAYANNWGNAYFNGANIDSSSSDWSMVATDSAHFSITPLGDPSVTLTLASGCSITNGYGCDPPPSAPEPETCTLVLLGTGLLGLGGTVKRKLFS